MEQRLVRWTAERTLHRRRRRATSGGTQSNLQALPRSRAERRGRGPRRPAAPSAGSSPPMPPTSPSPARAPARTARGRRRRRPRRRRGTHGRSRAGRVARRPSRRRASCPWRSSRLPAPPTAASSTRCPEIARAARAHGAWLHVDAAYGGGLSSRTRRHLLDGIETPTPSPSTTTRPASSPSPRAPCSCGRARTSPRPRTTPTTSTPLRRQNLRGRRAEPGRQVPPDHEALRRAEAVDTLRSLGPDAIGDMVDACCDLRRRGAGAARRGSCPARARHHRPLHRHLPLPAAPQGSTTAAPMRCSP